MSAFRTLNDLYRAFETTGPGRLVDPGDAGTITVSQWGQICSVVTATAETRTLARPVRQGIMCSVVLDTDGGDLTLTVTGGYNAAGDTSITFADAGDMVVMYSVKTGTTYQWTVIAKEGTNASTDVGFFGESGITQAAHIVDASDTSATDQKASINAILVVLEDLGFVAKS